MKKVLLTFAAAAVLVCGCAKNEGGEKKPSGGTESPSGMTFAPSVGDLPAEGLKTEWKDGDKIYVFFDDPATKQASSASTLPYLLLSYKGSELVVDASRTPEEIPAEGTLTAVHCPYSDGITMADGKFYVGKAATWYLYDAGVAYVNDGKKVSFALNMEAPEGLVELVIPSEGLTEDSPYTLLASNADASAGLKSITAACFDPATGEVSYDEGDGVEEIEPLIAGGKHIFCGKGVAPAEGSLTLELKEKDIEGNDLSVYTNSLSDVAAFAGSYTLPEVSAWISQTTAITTILYADGTLIINEKPEDHVANALKHGATLLTHGFVSNLNGHPENDEETGELKSALPWVSLTPDDPTNEWQNKIKKIEFGSELRPSIMYQAFINLGELWEVDTRNLIISSEAPSEDRSAFWRMTEAFKGCENLRTIDVSNWDVGAVTSMDYVFHDCRKLNVLDVSNWNVEKVTDMRGVFRQCQNLPVLDLSKWKTSSVTRTKEMFRGVFKVTELDLSGFNTAEVTDMTYMFYQCFALKTIYVSDSFATSNVGSGAGVEMFHQCRELVGGKGTKWTEQGNKEEKTDPAIGIEYARIDGGASAPGYFTEK